MMPWVSQSPPESLTIILSVMLGGEPFFLSLFVKVFHVEVNLILENIQGHDTWGVFIIAVSINPNNDSWDFTAVW